MVEQCEVCGQVPATTVTVRRHVGMLIVQKFYKVSPVLCRDHGKELAKSWLGKTVVQGWWGLISFFVNWFVVVSDLAALRKASSLDEPHPAPVG